ncbi:MAG: hypothetical protein RO009_13825 [Pseudorhodoplanes sp.]|jgi:hypothetical protein|nr:hypothetical protein [Pseudorhodoplanes sp.]
MFRIISHGMALTGLALALSACGGVHNQPREAAEPNVVPVNYKPEILAFLRTYLNDPTHIRGAFVSEPALMQIGGVQRYVACAKFNARKSSGEYEGSKERLVIFLAGRLDTMLPAKGDQCGKAVYHPFPELERLSR